MAYKEGKSTPA